VRFGPPPGRPRNTLGTHIRNKLVAGLLAGLPVAVTLIIVWYIDDKARALFGVKVPLLGIAVTLGGLYVLGVFVTSWLGQGLLRFTDSLLNHIPGLRDLYRSWKQVALTTDSHDGAFARVVLIPDETGQMKMIGFTSGRPLEGDPNTLCVFVPASPNPTSGRLFFVHREACVMLDVPTQTVLKMLISGGNYVPKGIGAVTVGLGAPPSAGLGAPPSAGSC
jgi:uncharacterized membrane protein